MDPLLTPTTALLYSFLEPSAFETPSASQNPAASEPDVFGKAFGAHNLLKNEILGNSTYPGSKGTAWEAASNYISPPRTIDLDSQGNGNSSIEKGQTSFCLIPLHAPAQEGFSSSPDKREVLATVSGYLSAEESFQGSK